MEVIEYPDRDMLAIDLANRLAGDLDAALLHHDQVSLVVPGGTSPGPVFDALSAADLDWARVVVMLSDERWVPESSPRSNAALIRKRLLTGRAGAATFLPFYVPGHAPETVLAALESRIAPCLPISVLLLGMGADRHTASLFPGAPELAAALAPDAPVLMPATPPAQPEQRVTLSARVLDGALAKHLILTGPDKRAALDEALHLPPEDAPVRAVLSDMTIHFSE